MKPRFSYLLPFVFLFGIASSLNAGTSLADLSELSHHATTRNTPMSDGIPSIVAERIYAYLAERGVKGKPEIATLDYKSYYLRTTLKQGDCFILIMADYFFDQDGYIKKSITEVHRVKYADCDILGKKVCDGIEKLVQGYGKEFREPYEGVIRVYETPEEAYFEVIQVAFGVEIWRKFDLEGNISPL